jgi:hypothetical protein
VRQEDEEESKEEGKEEVEPTSDRGSSRSGGRFDGCQEKEIEEIRESSQERTVLHGQGSPREQITLIS